MHTWVGDVETTLAKISGFRKQLTRQLLSFTFKSYWVHWDLPTVARHSARAHVAKCTSSQQGQNTASSGHYEHIVTATLHLLVLDQQVYKANVTDGYAVQ